MKTVLTLVSSGAIILLGFGVAGVMIASSKAEERGEPEASVPLVEVATPVEVSGGARVAATGIVEPSQQITLVPQVAGAVVHQSPQLTPGGRFSKGALILRVDARDYDLAATEAAARVAGAELALALEEGRGEVAQREWELLGGEGDSALALRGPQLEAARRDLEAARAGLKRAELAVERTALRAPFNAVVLNESVDPGQVIGGGPVATLVGTDSFRVSASVQVEDLELFQLPAPGQRGAAVTVTQQLGEQEIQRQGYVVGLAGHLDPQARTATVLVELPDPLDPPDGELPLLLSSYVELTITGHPQDGLVSLPRQALREGGVVWSLDGQDRLEPVPVHVAWSDIEHVYLRGVSPEHRVVTSRLSYAVQGMQLRVQE